MKITKSQLKQIIKEEIATVPMDNLVSGIAGLVQGVDPDDVSELFLQVYRQLPDVDIEMHDTPEEPEPEMRRRAGFGAREEVPADLPTQGKIRSPGLEEIIREELAEVYSDRQRRYMCAMKDASADERPEGLSQAEAEEQCSGPMKDKGDK